MDKKTRHMIRSIGVFFENLSMVLKEFADEIADYLEDE